MEVDKRVRRRKIVKKKCITRWPLQKKRESTRCTTKWSKQYGLHTERGFSVCGARAPQRSACSVNVSRQCEYELTSLGLLQTLINSVTS